jgi:acyl CoA:acetate/3-ketoacid CoA transferase beta subunit
MVITDLCVLVMDPVKRRFVLTEVAPGVTVQEVRAKTEAEIVVGQRVATVAV